MITVRSQPPPMSRGDSEERERPPKRPRFSDGEGKVGFKALCPDNVVATLIGSKGARRKQLEEETGAKVIMSGRDEYFPGSRCRIVTIVGDDRSRVLAMLERITGYLVDCAAQEQEKGLGKGKSQLEDTLLGKEEGEYVFRLSLPHICSGGLIGTRGERIKRMREEVGAKVFIDNETQNGNQMVRIIGPQSVIAQALDQVLEIIETEVSPEMMADWVSSPMQGVEQKGKGKDGGGKGKGRDKDGGGKGKGKDDDGKGSELCGDFKNGNCTRGDRCRYSHGDPNGGGHRDEYGDFRSPPRVPIVDRRDDRRRDSYRGGDDHNFGYSNEEAPQGPGADDSLQALSMLMGEFPVGKLDMDYQMSCELPNERVGGLIGKKGDFINYVQQTTGTKIVFEKEGKTSADSTRTMVLTGPLISVYSAHMMMMKRYHEDVERDEAAREPPSNVEDLKAQLAALQAQVHAIEGGGRSKGGKGKR